MEWEHEEEEELVEKEMVKRTYVYKSGVKG